MVINDHHQMHNCIISFLTLPCLQRKISMTSMSVLGILQLWWSLVHPRLPATQCVCFTKEPRPSLKPICTVRTGHCGADMSPFRSTRILPLRDWRCVRLMSTQARYVLCGKIRADHFIRRYNGNLESNLI